MNFNENDIKQITEHGLTLDAVKQQLTYFERGFPYADIVAPATTENYNISKLSDTSIERYSKIYDEFCKNHTVTKFVPASGAATRMFRDLFEFLNTGEKNKTTEMVLGHLTEFAFYDDLKRLLPENPTDSDIISHIITDAGLNYGNMPKGLLAFHKYEHDIRTAVAEHLSEGAQYATSADGIVNIHFTVSPEHIDGFNILLSRDVPKYEQKFGVKYNISLSTQKSSTDTIAVNPDNTPFRTDDGKLLFRPAGHGALIENLNEIDSDIIFIKNIDNVCPETNRADTIKYKRALAGLLIDFKMTNDAFIREIDLGGTPLTYRYITHDLGINLPADATLDDMRAILNRPIRVCGVVKNNGAPGGGPFIVRDKNGSKLLQIIESAQIAPEKRDIMNKSTYFNPVDLVCYVRDFDGNKFDLTKFVDPDTGFISEKSSNGRPLRAMERPGLWNGAMANWITLFVEVPITTFTPAKVVTDLISDGHKNKNEKNENNT